MKKVKKGVQLKDSDFMLFRYLHAVKVSTHEQIARDVYREYSLRSVGNRLRKLENNGYITTSSSRLLSQGKRIVSLAKQSFLSFVANQLEARIELKSDSIRHDLALVDIRYRFMKSPKIHQYQTENEIQTWNSQHRKFNSDALVTVEIAKCTIEVPLEYEGSMKKASRYEPFLKRYYQSDDYPIVFIVSDSELILDKIKRIERQMFDWDKPKFFYQLLSTLKSSEALALTNRNGANLRLE